MKNTIKTVICSLAIYSFLIPAAHAESKLTQSEVLMMLSLLPTTAPTATLSGGDTRGQEEINKEEAISIQQDIALFEATNELTSELAMYSSQVMKVKNISLDDSLDILDQVSLFVIETN